MNNQRRFVRLEVADFLEIRPSELSQPLSKGASANLTPMGICFFSEVQWDKNQVLDIDYFIPQEHESVLLKARMIWSEFISEKDGYLNGGEILDVAPDKELIFVNYYFQKLKQQFFNR